MRHAPLLLALLAGCPKGVPDHLRVNSVVPDSDAKGPPPITDLPSAIGAIVASDPLVRSPSIPPNGALDGIAGTEPLQAYVEQVRLLESGEGQVQRAMQQVEDAFRGTEGVAIARGYRLRVTENLLANQAQKGPGRDGQILALITPLNVSVDGAAMNRGPLDWLAKDAPSDVVARRYAERWVLTGWLESPGVYIGPAGAALDADMYDGLSQTPVGALVASRARASAGDPAEGLALLRDATYLALQEVAADRDKEQAAWAAVRDAAATNYGDDPIRQLLMASTKALTPMGGNDAAVGGALLALSAQRWRGACDDAPCVGVDRVDAMGVARRWSSEIDALGHVWQVIALKEALDTMDVAHTSVMYPSGAVSLVDAILGTGGGPLDDQVLRKRSPDAGVWLSLARAVGEEGVTEWEGARAALGAHLKREAEAAAAQISDPQMTSFLDKIASRAVP